MVELATLPDELAFIRPFLPTGGFRYRTASWLSAAFDDPIWCVHTSNPFTLDWNVRISGGSRLTSARHRTLWTIFRSWLVLQSHPDTTGGRALAPGTEYNRLTHVLTWIDYLLLNGDRLGLAEHGLEMLTDSDFTAALATIAGGSRVSSTIYQWPQRLAGYVAQRAQQFTQSELEETIEAVPFLATSLPPLEERVTALNDQQLIRARAALWRDGMYAESSCTTFRYAPNTPRLTALLFADTLRGRTLRVTAPELMLVPDHRRLREYPAAPVTSRHDHRMSLKRLEQYRLALHSLGALRGELPVPQVCGTDRRALRAVLDLKQAGRMRTLPRNIVFQAFERAVAFALEHGDDLIRGYLDVARRAHRENISVHALSLRSDICRWLPDRLVALGVAGWTIEPNNTRKGPSVVANIGMDTYYSRLRKHYGLYELIRVLYGAIQIVVGTLMARRCGELEELVCGECLDAGRTWLHFRNRKSGVGKWRELESRPIPPLAVMLISKLEHLQRELIKAGCIDRYTYLFAAPSFSGPNPLQASRARYNDSIDYFCDYAQLPLNEHGERHYIRQHQLRRFFAMLFFWGGSVHGLDTLRWFLGHTDAAHLYHYISENTPGAVLRSVKAEWVTQAVQADLPEVERLRSLLEQRFGVSDYRLLDADALALHIEDLMAEGQVSVEPVFVDDGRRYQIMVVVASHAQT